MAWSTERRLSIALLTLVVLLYLGIGFAVYTLLEAAKAAAAAAEHEPPFALKYWLLYLLALGASATECVRVLRKKD